MNIVYLLIGGNLGDRLDNLHKAIEAIGENCGQILAVSSIYETEAWGYTDQPSFYNQAIQLETSIFPERLMKKLLETESKLGRVREEKMGPRVIDIDILLVEDQLFNTDILKAPHPFLAQRRFALIPLAEIAADVRDPASHKRISTLLAECPDTLEVKKLELV